MQRWLRIPPTAVGGLFKPNLQKRMMTQNPTDGSRWIVQVQPTHAEAGLEQSTDCRRWDSGASHFLCRLDLNNPPTAVGGIGACAVVAFISQRPSVCRTSSAHSADQQGLLFARNVKGRPASSNLG